MGQTAEELRELREELADRRAMVSEDLEAIGDRVSPGRMAERRKAQVRGYVHRARDAVMGAADSVSGAAGAAGSMAGDAPDAIRSRTQGAPLAAGLVAFGAGFVAASLAPATRPERDAASRLEPAMETAAAELGSAAATVGEQVRDEAREAVADLRESAQESAHRVTEPATESSEGPAGGTAPSTF